MLDTIKLTINQKLSPEELKGWQHEVRGRKSGFINNSYRRAHKLRNGALISAIYRPRDFSGNPQYNVEFSLPNVLYGSNLKPIVDLQNAFEQFGRRFSERPIFPLFPIQEARISRLDFAFNHDVGENLPGYISYLQRVTYPRRRRETFNNDSVYFRTRQADLKFYDKYAQSKLPEARGLLRQEITLKTPHAVKQVFPINNIASLSFYPLARALNEALETLNLHKSIPSSGIATASTLLQRNGIYEGAYKFGLLHLNTILTKSQIAVAADISPRTVSRHIKNIAEDSFATFLSLAGAPLPPLSCNPVILEDKRMLEKGLGVAKGELLVEEGS